MTYQITRALSTAALVEFTDEYKRQIDDLEEAVSLVVSHDGVRYYNSESKKMNGQNFSGTAKEKVTQDYTSHLTKSWDSAEKILSSKRKNIPNLSKQFLCRKINESECEFTRFK